MECKVIIIENYDFPIRLDRYLRTIDPTLTQGVIEGYLRKNLIKVNNSKASSNLRVANGDELMISQKISDQIQSFHQKKEINDSPMVISLANKLLGEYLLLDHPLFLAVNKPAGLATQGGTKISLSLDDALRFLSTKGFDLRLVHRLDKDTSGVLLIAKTRAVSDKFMHAFKKHKIQKTYMAILSSIPRKPKGNVTSYLIKEKDFEVSSYETEVEGSKIAITDYEVVETKNNMALVRFKPITGRMHQLRVHSRLLGSPIVGDTKYGGVIASNLMLHAAELIIDKCIFDDEIKIKAQVPQHFIL